MSTITIRTADRYAPALVSEVPGSTVALRRSFWARLRDKLLARRASQRFERAMSLTHGSETGDLLAALRRMD